MCSEPKNVFSLYVTAQKWTKMDWMGLKWNEVDLIGSNRNCLIFRKNKLFSKNFREQIIHYIIITK